jgi:chemotaxis methyl-accepting protein methylase
MPSRNEIVPRRFCQKEIGRIYLREEDSDQQLIFQPHCFTSNYFFILLNIDFIFCKNIIENAMSLSFDTC